MQHLKWEKTGRTFQGDQPNQFIWEGRVGQECTFDGQQWLPYLWKAVENKLQYGQAPYEVEFASDKQILRAAGNVLCSSFKFFVQAYVGGQWVDQPHGVPTKNIAHDYPTEGACTGYLDFPNAHLSFGAQLPYDLQLGLEITHHARATLGIRVRAPVSGQLRFQVVLDGLTKLPADWEWITCPTSHDDPTLINIGIRVRDMEWRWGKSEAPYRSITKEDNPDGTIKITITFGPYAYTANTWLTVYPDSWGPTAVAADADDGSEYSVGNSGSYAGTWASAGLYGTGLYQERDTVISGNLEKIAAWRWLPVITGTVTSVDAGTQIVFTNNGDNGIPTHITSTLVADNAADAPVWGSGTARPSQRTATAASVNLTGAAGNQTISVQAIVSEKIVTEGNPYSGTQGMAFWAYCTSNHETDYWGISNEYGHGGTLATLAIVYTVAATGVTWSGRSVTILEL